MDPDSNLTPPNSRPNSPTCGSTENDSGKRVHPEMDYDPPTSFRDLGFADFTTKKFPLIAKAFCEDNSALKVKKTNPVFKCQKCSKEFPVEGARDLHEASHVPEEYTRCPKCDCHFSDSTRLQEHMLKHVSDVKFEKSLDGEDNDAMPQKHFLAQFGLITAEDHVPVTLNVEAKMETEEDGKDFSIADPSEVESMDTNVCGLEIAESQASNDEQSQGSENDESQILTLPVKQEDMPLSRFNKSSNLSESGSLQQDDQKSNVSETSSTDGKNDDVRIMTLPMRPQEGIPAPTFECKHCDMVLNSAKAFKSESTHLSYLSFSF